MNYIKNNFFFVILWKWMTINLFFLYKDCQKDGLMAFAVFKHQLTFRANTSVIFFQLTSITPNKYFHKIPYWAGIKSREGSGRRKKNKKKNRQFGAWSWTKAPLPFLRKIPEAPGTTWFHLPLVVVGLSEKYVRI